MNINSCGKFKSGSVIVKCLIVLCLLGLPAFSAAAQDVSPDLPADFPSEFDQYTFLHYGDADPFLVVEKDGQLEYLKYSGGQWQNIMPGFSSVLANQQLELIEVIRTDSSPALLVKSVGDSDYLYLLSINAENDLFLVADGPVNGTAGSIDQVSIFRTKNDDAALMYIIDGNLIFSLYDPASGAISSQSITSLNDTFSYDMINSGDAESSDKLQVAIVSNANNLSVAMLNSSDGQCTITDIDGFSGSADNFFLISGTAPYDSFLVFSVGNKLFSYGVSAGAAAKYCEIAAEAQITYLLPFWMDEDGMSVIVTSGGLLYSYEYSSAYGTTDVDAFGEINADADPILLPFSSTDIYFIYQNGQNEYRALSGIFTGDSLTDQSDIFSGIEYKDDGFADVYDVVPSVYQLEYTDTGTILNFYMFDPGNNKFVPVLQNEVDVLLSDPAIVANAGSKLFFFSGNCFVVNTAGTGFNHFRNIIKTIPTQQRQFYLLSVVNQHVSVISIASGEEK